MPWARRAAVLLVGVLPVQCGTASGRLQLKFNVKLKLSATGSAVHRDRRGRGGRGGGPLPTQAQTGRAA